MEKVKKRHSWGQEMSAGKGSEGSKQIVILNMTKPTSGK